MGENDLEELIGLIDAFNGVKKRLGACDYCPLFDWSVTPECNRVAMSILGRGAYDSDDCELILNTKIKEITHIILEKSLDEG